MNQLSVISHFESYIPLTAAEKNLLVEKFSLQKIKKKQKILQEGSVCRHYTFVEEGCLRLYGIDKGNNEHNILFAAEGDWIADIGSFHTRTLSRLNIEAIEASVIYQVNQEDLYFLYYSIPKLDRIFKVITENKYIELQNRVLQNFSSGAEERYLLFLEQYPILSLRLPNVQVASYLGITPEFLSKIRNGLKSKSLRSRKS